MTKLQGIDNLTKDRRVRADAIFAEINFPASVEDFEGWEFSTGALRGRGANTWSRTVYLLNEDPEKPTTKHTFSIEFRACSCVPMTAWLDEKELVLP